MDPVTEMHTTDPSNNASGFTLVELSIVLFIVALMLGGMMLPLSAQQDIRARQETEKNLGEIRDALVGFAVINGRLPRPATSAVNGVENSATCSTDADCSGFIPWATLGTPKTDSWNKLIRYSVTPAFANAAVTTSTQPNRAIQTRDGAGALVYLAGDGTCTTPGQCVPVVIFSHGRSRHGTSDAGTAIPDGSTTNMDEDTNNTGPSRFISRVGTDNTSAAGGEFDDMVIWISGNSLFNRLVSAGKI